METGIFSYTQRQKYVDAILNTMSNDTNTKFYILTWIHYTFFFILDVVLLFSNSFYIVYLCYCILLFQIVFNYIDNGCFLMKLERKYIGKTWVGPYRYIDSLFGTNYMNEDTIPRLFYILSSVLSCIGIFKLGYLTLYRI